MRATKKSLLMSVGVLALTAAPVLAQDNRPENPWYVGIRGGVSLAEKSSLEGRESALLGHSAHDTGLAFGGAVGYNFGGVRLEAELSRHLNDVDNFAWTNDGGFGFGTGEVAADSGKTRATNLMGNLYYDMDFGIPTKPYIGFGMGASRLGFDSYRTGATSFIDDSKTVFAYQAIAGVRHAISEKLDLSVDYRFFQTEDPNILDTLGRRVLGDYSSHLVMVGLSWKFGGGRSEPVRTAAQEPAPRPEPAPAVEPTPAPEPMPAPAVEPAAPGPFLVYFAFDSAEISSEAAQVIDQAAAAAREMAPVRLVLKGHADTAGPSDYNDRLSERRAQAVRQALVDRGMNGNEISYETEAYGEERPAVETGDGVREPQNRRVQISFDK